MIVIMVMEVSMEESVPRMALLRKRLRLTPWLARFLCAGAARLTVIAGGLTATASFMGSATRLMAV